MPGEIEILYTEEFQKDVRKIRDSLIRIRIKKLIGRLTENPNLGKPLKYELSGFRSLRIKPFRLIYEFKNNQIILHKFEHRDEVY